MASLTKSWPALTESPRQSSKKPAEADAFDQSAVSPGRIKPAQLLENMRLPRQIRLSELSRAISQLPEDLREVFEMYALAMMTSAQIAELLSLSEPAVRYRVGRGREEIRKFLYPDDPASKALAVAESGVTADELRQHSATCTFNLMYSGEVPY